MSTPNKPNEVATPIGFFEYHVTPNEEVIQTIQIPATEPNATPEIIELKECYGTIVEMMSYTDEHFLEFGADLYYLLEHCFTEPIPREVYKSFHKSAQGTDIDAYLTTIPTLSRVEWLVFWDNPAEKLYDVLAVKMGGKIVMPQRKGQLKKYVITKEDFMNKVYRYNRD